MSRGLTEISAIRVREMAPRNDGSPNGFLEFLCVSAAVLWRHWPKENMRATYIPPSATQKLANQFSLNGECPHCNRPTVFTMATAAHIQNMGGDQIRLWAVMQCQGCFEFICAGVSRSGPSDPNCHYQAH